MEFPECRLKYCVRTPISNGVGAAAEYDDPRWPRYVRITDIADRRVLRDDTFASLPPDVASEAPFEVGDILAASVGATFGKTYHHSKEIGPVAYAGYLVKISLRSEFDPRYVSYWTESSHYWHQVMSSVVQSTIQNFSASKYAQLRLPAPMLQTQRAIADYLDQATTQIDVLVAEKEELLKLLAEKRRSITSHAVTKGLDLCVSLRDSGIPWIGKIPAHWRTERARWLFCERVQRSESGKEELLTVSHLTGVTPRSEKVVHMFEANTTEGYKICREGDLVINTLWAWMGAMGISPMAGIVSPAYHVYEPTEQLVPGYVGALVRLPVFAEEVARHSKGVWSSRLRLYPENFFEVSLPLPPLHEQREIISAIDGQNQALDAFTVAAEHAIALLKERRAALISAAVTGRIKVGRTT